MLGCSRCGTENEDSARLCRNCGKELSARDFGRGVVPPVKREAVAQRPDEQIPATVRRAAPATRRAVTCPSCGQYADADARFCPGCGRGLAVPEYGSFGRRLGGYLIDYIIVAVTAVIPAVVVAAIIIASAPDTAFTAEQLQQQQDAERNASIASSIISVVIGLGYYVGLNANGGTLGKRAVGLRLEDHSTGENIGVPRAFARYVVAIISGLAIALGYLWCIWDDEKQTWHDKAAGSVVVRT